MNGWRLKYQAWDGKDKTVYLSLPDDEYTTALAVQIAAAKGKFLGVDIKPGATVVVKKQRETA